MTDAPDPKADLRKAAFAARKAAHEDAGRAVPAATRHLLSEIGPPEGRIVSGYMPIRTELDPVPAMAALHEAGARLCVPVIPGRGVPLEFRAWRPGAAMVEGPFGAMIPEEDTPLVPDTLIVPLLAFDRRLDRLGYGGGYYDRTLCGLRAAGPVRAIGYAFAAQEVPRVPTEATDQPLDAVVTEAGVLHR
jgi:5-formyltetrahydrofolate cyclo-ligase